MLNAIKKIGEKTGTFVSNTAEKANEVLELQKLSMKAGSIQRGMKEQYAQIGKYFYEELSAKGEINSELTANFERIAGLQVELDMTKARMEDIKAIWQEEKAAKADKTE